MGQAIWIELELNDHHIPFLTFGDERLPNKLQAAVLQQPAPFYSFIAFTTTADCVLKSILTALYLGDNVVKGHFLRRTLVLVSVSHRVLMPILTDTVVSGKHGFLGKRDGFVFDVNAHKVEQTDHQRRREFEGNSVAVNAGLNNLGLVCSNDFNFSLDDESKGIPERTFAPVGKITGEDNDGGHVVKLV